MDKLEESVSTDIESDYRKCPGVYMNQIDVYQYPGCTSCIKAVKWLKDKNVEVCLINIVEDTPDRDDLKVIISKSGLPLKKFFNTSGKRYRELGLKERLPEMTLDEAAELLASDGMLIKRPLVIHSETILTGFREDEWTSVLL